MGKIFKYRFITYYIRYSFGFLSILVIDLAVGYFIQNVITIEARKLNPHIRTVIGMVVSMILFYFFLDFIDRWTKKLLHTIRDSSQKLGGQKFGIYLITGILFFALYCGYYNLWFQALPFKWLHF